MTKDSRTGRAGSTGKDKQTWVTPALIRIEAGEAEVGTRNVSDGPFTSS